MKEVMQIVKVETDSTGSPSSVFWKDHSYRVRAILDHWTYAFPWNPEGLGHDRYFVELETLQKVRLDYNRRTNKWLLTHEQIGIAWFGRLTTRLLSLLQTLKNGLQKN